MVLNAHPVVDAILPRYAGVLGTSRDVYRNHVLRGLNYQSLLLDAAVSDTAALAWVVHDLGIWTAGSFDYLRPSADLAAGLAVEFGIADTERAKAMVMEHHRMRRVADPEVETFRLADLTDVSRGILRGRLSRAQIDDVVKSLPYLGFHRWLAAGLGRHALRHPLKPAPMMRW